MKLDVKPCTIDHRVLALIKNGSIEVPMWTDTSHRYYHINYHSENYLYGRNEREHTHIEAELTKLDTWAMETLKELNSYLYQNLKDTYEYLTSDEAVQQAIEANEYLFTANGVHADWLGVYAVSD